MCFSIHSIRLKLHLIPCLSRHQLLGPFVFMIGLFLAIGCMWISVSCETMTTTWARCLKSNYSGSFLGVSSLIGPDSPSKEAAGPVCTTQGKNYERVASSPICVLFSVVVPPSRSHSCAWRLGLTIWASLASGRLLAGLHERPAWNRYFLSPSP